MWSKTSLEPKNTYYWKIGRREIFLQKKDKDWLLSQNDLQEPISSPVFGEKITIDSDVEWLTFIGDKNNVLLTLPSFPDRPIVIKPESSLKILPGKNVLFYMQIPLWVQFYAGTRKNENLIYEFQSQELSSTWFGESDNGILAYSLTLNLARAMEKPEELLHHIVCPVRVLNDSSTTLDLQRLLLHGEFLTIYKEDDKFWSNEVKIRFKGKYETSDVQYANQAPSFLKSATQISPARNSKPNNVISKSFHFIKSLTNY